MRRLAFYAVCLGGLGASAVAMAPFLTSFQWEAATSGNWTSSTLWSPDGVPNGAGNSATIAATGSDYTVSLNTNVADLDAFTLDSGNATLDSFGRLLTASTIDIENGTLRISASTWTGSTAFNNGGLIRVLSGSTINGPLSSTGTVSIEAANTSTTLTANNGFDNSGLLSMASAGGGYTGQLSVNGGNFNNNGGGTVDLLLGSGGLRNLDLTLVNNGTVNVNASTSFVRNSVNHINNGAFNIGASGSVTHSMTDATFTQEAGTMNVTGPFVVNNGADFVFNGGTITGRPTISNANLIFGPGSSGAGGFVVLGSSNLTGSLAASRSVLIFASNQGTTLTSALGFTNAGLIEMESAGGGYTAQLTVASGALTNTGVIRTNLGSGGLKLLNTDILNSGTLQFNIPTAFSKSGGTYTNTGTMNSPTLASMTGSGQVFNQNSGTMNLTGGGFDISSATFNFNGGTITGQPRVFNGNLNIAEPGSGEVTYIGSGTLSGTIGANKAVHFIGNNQNTIATAANGFVNNGTMTMSAVSGGYTSSIAATTGNIVNNGTLTTLPGSGGARTIAGNFVNAGIFNVNLATSFNKTSGIYSNTGTINLTAPLSYSGLSQVFNMQSGLITGGDFFSVSNGGTFNFNGGTINGKASIGDSTLNIAGSGTGAGAFFARGASTLSGNIKSPQQVHVEGASSHGAATLTSAVGYTNAGNLLLQSRDGGYTTTLAVTSGILNNTGTLTSGLGTGGARSIAASLANTGTVNIEAPTSLTKASGTHSNDGGTINLNSTLSMSGQSQVFSQNGGTISGGDNFLLHSNTFNFNGGTILGKPRLDTSTLNIGALATGTAAFEMAGSSTMTGNIKSGTTVHAQGSAYGSTATLTSPTGYSNAGNILLQSRDGGYPTYIVVTSGAITNTGNFTSNVGSGGARTVAASLVNSGTVNINAPTAFSKADAVHINSGGAWNLASTMTVNGLNQTFRSTGGTLNAGNLFHMSANKFDYTGGTITGAPHLNDSQLTLAASAFNPATFRMGGSGSTLVGNVLLGHEVHVNGNSSDSTAIVTAATGFSNAGTIRLESNDGGYSSLFAITSGTLLQQPSGKLLFNPGTGGARSATVTLNNNGLVEFNTSATLGRAGATHSNGGTFRVVGNNTASVTGTAFLNGTNGSVEGNGTITVSGFSNGGTVAPGLPLGKLTLAGTHTQTSNGVLSVDLAGNAQGSTYDWYAVTGAATIAGKLRVNLLNNFDPVTGTEFTVMTATSITGAFSSLSLTNFPPNKSAEIVYTANSVKVRIVDGVRVNPDSYLVTIGYEINGDLNSLFNSDQNRLGMFPDEVTLRTRVEITGTSPTANPVSIRLSLESSVERRGISEVLEMFNYNSNTWAVVEGRVATVSDSTVDGTIGVNAPQFIGPAGIMKMRVTWSPINDEDPSQDGWIHLIDLAYWTLAE